LIEITTTDFDASQVIAGLRSETVGAIVSFIGTVRDFNEFPHENGVKKVDVKELIYECYDDMAVEKMKQIKEEAQSRFKIDNMIMIHRKGSFKPSDQVVIVAVSAAHRKDAFLACEYAIEELKKEVPIWKKEVGINGEYWVGEKGKGVEEND
jgi:molybdopterin synthase catalytic subunit